MRFVLLIIFSLAAASCFAHAGHKDKPQACHDKKVECAQALSIALDGKNQLWRAFVIEQTLYLQKRLSTGQFTPAIAVNSKPEAIISKGEDRPSIAFGQQGQIYLAWTRAEANFTGQIRFSRSIDGGKTFSPAMTVNKPQTGILHRFPIMATNAKGLIFIAWIDGRDASTAHESAAIYYNWSDDHGAHFQAHDKPLSTVACSCCRLALSFDEQQLPEVFFRDIFSNNERDHSLVRFAGIDKPLPKQRISFGHWQFNGCPHKGPAMLNVQGREHFIWFSKDQLYYRQQVNETLSQSTAIASQGSDHASLAFANGVLYRSWQVYANQHMQIWLQSSNDNGQTWQAAKLIKQTQQASDYAQLVSNGQHVYLSWLSQQYGHLLIDVSKP